MYIYIYITPRRSNKERAADRALHMLSSAGAGGLVTINVCCVYI